MMGKSSFQISHSFINSLNDPILILYNNWQCLTANVAFEKKFNLSAQEIRERHVKFLIPEIIIESHLKPLLEGYNISDNKSIDVPIKLNDQPRKIHNIKLHPEFDQQGKIQTLFLIIRDIGLTENPYQLLQYITEYSDDLLYMMNNEQRFTYFSSSIEKILGYKPEEAVGLYAKDILPRETYNYQIELFTKHMQQPDRNEEPAIMRGQMICKNGEAIWGEAHARIIYNNNKEPIGAFGVLRDITEKLKTERELAESHKKLSLITENSEDMIYATDMNQNFTYFSPSVEKILGYSREEALKLNVSDIMTRESYQYQLDLFKKDIEELEDLSEASAIIEVEMIRNDGSTFWGQTYARIIVNEEKQPSGIFGICRDITLQKEKERELQESKEKFKLLTGYAVDMIYVVKLNESQNFKYVSPSVKNILGYTVEEAYNISAKDMLTEESFQYQNKKLTKTINEATDYKNITETLQLQLVRKDGTKIWGEAHARILTDKEGNPAEIIGIMRDITERKNYEQALELSEEKFKNIYHNANDAIFIVNQNGTLLDVNKVALDRLKYSREELLKLNPYDWTSDKYKNLIKEKVEELRKNGSLIYETMHKTKHNKNIPTEVNAKFINYNGEKAVLAIARDISKRKEAENQRKIYQDNLFWLSQSALTFLTLQSEADIYDYIGNTLSSKVPDAIFLINKIDEENNKVKAQNIYGITSPVLQKLINISGVNPLGKEYTLESSFKKLYKEQKIYEYGGNLSEFAQGYYSETFIQKLQSLLDIKNVYSIGLSKGSMLFASIHIFKKNSPLKQINLLETFFNQASIALQRKLIESELIVAKEKAEEGNRLKSAFLTNLSHEIRTPLNIMMGYLQMLEDPNMLPEEKERSIKIIQNSSNQLLNMIEDILNMAKIETGQIEIQKEKTDINHLLKTLFHSFEHKVNNKKINFNYQTYLRNGRSVVLVDKNKIQQILINLLSNAFKFTSEGAIKFGYTEKDANYLTFFVKDTGIGIDPKKKDKVFERFFQIEQKNNRKFEGTGIGLSISKALVEMMDGEIWFESQKEKGTAFYFKIPCEKAN